MYKNIRTPPASTADFFGSVESASACTCRRERLEGKIQERYGLAKD
jgi:hypothetical protein